MNRWLSVIRLQAEQEQSNEHLLDGEEEEEKRAG